MKNDEFTKPGRGDVADYFCERDKKYGTTELTVLAVFKLHMNKTQQILHHNIWRASGGF